MSDYISTCEAVTLDEVLNKTTTIMANVAATMLPWATYNFTTVILAAASTDFVKPEFVFEDTTQRTILAALALIASVVGVPGNTLVIVAVAFSKKLHTKTNAFVVSLAISDLITALALPFDAVALLSDQWPLSDTVCTLVAGIIWIGLGSSIFNLAMIAFNRYYLITRPRCRYDRLYTRRNLALMVAFAWAWPVAVITVPPLCDVGAIGYSERYKICSADSTHPRSDLYSFLSSIVAGVPCLVVIVTCYVQIFRFIRAKNRSLHRSSQSEGRTVENSSAKDTRTTAAFKRQVKVTKNMFLVVCMYLVAIMPFTITCLFPKKYHVIPWVSMVLLLNCCVNPIVYGLKHPQFRGVFSKIIHCKLREIEEPSKLLHSITSSTYVSVHTKERQSSTSV